MRKMENYLNIPFTPFFLRFLVSQQVADGVPREGYLDTAHSVWGYLVGIIDIRDTLSGYVEILVGHHVIDTVTQSAQIFLGLCFISLRDEGFEQKAFQRFVVIINEKVLFVHCITRHQVVVLDKQVAVSVGAAGIFVHVHGITPEGWDIG